MDRRHLDELDLRRLIAEYADAVNRRDWTHVAGLFAAGARLHLDLIDRGARTLVGGDAVAAFIDGAIQRFDFFEFVALNVVVTAPEGVGPEPDAADDDIARLRTFMCEIRHHGPLDDQPDTWSTAYGLYQDTAVRTEGTWRFA